MHDGDIIDQLRAQLAEVTKERDEALLLAEAHKLDAQYASAAAFDAEAERDALKDDNWRLRQASCVLCQDVLAERDALKNKAATSEEFLQRLNGQVEELVKLLDPTFDGPPDAWSLFDLVNLAKSKLSTAEARVAEADAAAQRYSDAMAEAQREAAVLSEALDNLCNVAFDREHDIREAQAAGRDVLNTLASTSKPPALLDAESPGFEGRGRHRSSRG